ncbi:type II secretion system protein [Aureliella helgolandensis]|uniref:Type II secretion system protein G n=1 Tax=Aureliella helgolandensis TaxID=2527968 RepID=A0A518G2Y5_9BACT|nr:type II secretion system protein [Aureliella helgolandensis]QDV22952.1 hypothetical protein Q31a_12450 [Aureliella helgolandensis]
MLDIQLTRPLAPRYRPSFTLIELLVVVAIIGIMSSMVLYTLAGAQTDAKVSLTRSTIEKLNAVILEEWEGFRYRAARIDIDPDMLRPQLADGQPLLRPREGARLRMFVLRDLMRMELPDRMSDLVYSPAYYSATLSNGATYSVVNRIAPGKYNSLRQRIGIAPLIGGGYTDVVKAIYRLPVSGPQTPPPEFNVEFQGAEMLYQIVASSTHGGGSALEAFRPTEIGDVDGDGLPEFLDAWGVPIRWLRWPAGYASPLNDTTSPDAMDPLRSDLRWRDGDYTQKPWQLVPLIISAGPDGVFDVSFDIQDSSGAGIAYATNLDPYVGSYDTDGSWLGMGLGANIDEDSSGNFSAADDNITNYSLLLE